MRDLTERRLSRREIYEGKVLHLVADTVLLPDGSEALREICLHVGASCILPLLDDGTVLMERQYRYAHGRTFFEIPAGKRNSKDEDFLEAAKRELREETGAIADRWTYLGELDTSPALVDEKIGMFLAEGLHFSSQSLDDDEFLELERVPLAELHRMVMAGEIADAKTQIAVLKVWELKHPGAC